MEGTTAAVAVAVTAAVEKPVVVTTAKAMAAVATAAVTVVGDFSGDDREPDLLDQ